MISPDPLVCFTAEDLFFCGHLAIGSLVKIMEMRSLLVDSHIVPLTELGDDEAKAAFSNGSILHKSTPFCLYMSVCLSVCVCAFVSVCLCLCICECVCARARACVHVCACVRMCVLVGLHTKSLTASGQVTF